MKYDYGLCDNCQQKNLRKKISCKFIKTEDGLILTVVHRLASLAFDALEINWLEGRLVTYSSNIHCEHYYDYDKFLLRIEAQAAD